ncbi:MAG: GHKL domain-containing protein [Lachnospiraceae bacterium]|nr:GHKL domain-containing protein [Lachnospiraceae bacterium]
MIMGNKNLKREYDELHKKYIEIFAEKSELEYELAGVKAETEFVKKQDEEIRELHENARKLKHDMKNHLMVIASYINEGEYEKAKNYTSEILDKFNSMHSYVETGNTLMNHIINEKLQYARKKGILIKAEIENLEFKRMKSIDFSAVLSNMLDNAIEASEREKNITPEIHVSIVRIKGYETIGIKNKIEKSILKDNPELKSMKEEKNHGLGVGQIRSIVEQYQGMCDFYEEDDFFCVKIFIPQ